MIMFVADVHNIRMKSARMSIALACAYVVVNFDIFQRLEHE